MERSVRLSVCVCGGGVCVCVVFFFLSFLFFLGVFETKSIKSFLFVRYLLYEI